MEINWSSKAYEHKNLLCPLEIKHNSVTSEYTRVSILCDVCATFMHKQNGSCICWMRKSEMSRSLSLMLCCHFFYLILRSPKESFWDRSVFIHTCRFAHKILTFHLVDCSYWNFNAWDEKWWLPLVEKLITAWESIAKLFFKNSWNTCLTTQFYETVQT